ncbi:MAG: acyl carrier protein [Gammaproteobacteria bacterium]|jgi:acyl carrier protein|nr:acyl carrier protein [Gammaproteobacteria bacterium]
MQSHNEQRLKEVFSRVFSVPVETINDDVKYRETKNFTWDSIMHMSLIAEIENEFGIMLETDDVIDMSSFLKAKEIVAKYVND